MALLFSLGAKEKKRRKTRKVLKARPATLKVQLGKKAADKRKRLKQLRDDEEENQEEENQLDYGEDHEEDEDQNEAAKKKKEEETVWKMGGRNIDPKVRGNYGPKLVYEAGDLFENDSYVDYFLIYLPDRFIRDIMLPETNRIAKEQDPDFKEFTYDEFINILGLFYFMEVVRLPERRMYWSSTPNELFPGFNFSRVISINRFEEFLNFWQLGNGDDVDQHVLDFINAVNDRLKETIQPGETLCIDESMIKSYHRNLKGKMKIIRKPRPIGNELKTMSDGKSKIVIHMELHEGKEDMVDKDYVQEFGATTSCCLRLTEYYKGSGQIVIGDSWFGSVKSCVQLYNVNGLYSNMLVKTAHKQYPRYMLRENIIKRGEWLTATANISGVNVMAVRFLDLQEKQFISSCSTSLPGPPCKTKHHGNITRPQVAFQYLETSPSIDQHNQFRTSSCGLEDVWMTKNPIHRQIAGVLGFLFTNAYLTKKHFQKTSIKHYEFKLELANKMVKFKEETKRMRRVKIDVPVLPKSDVIHVPQLLKVERYQKYCYYCQHDSMKPPVIIKTSYYCSGCGITKPICHPSTERDCFRLHIIHGMPKKRRFVKK